MRKVVNHFKPPSLIWMSQIASFQRQNSSLHSETMSYWLTDLWTSWQVNVPWIKMLKTLVQFVTVKNCWGICKEETKIDKNLEASLLFSGVSIRAIVPDISWNRCRTLWLAVIPSLTVEILRRSSSSVESKAFCQTRGSDCGNFRTRSITKSRCLHVFPFAASGQEHEGTWFNFTV